MKVIGLLSITVAIIIFYASVIHVPSSLQPLFVGFDKVVHFCFYFVFVIALFIDFAYHKKKTIKTYGIIIFTATCYGGIIELIQEYLTVSRSGEFMDLLADFIGATVATIILLITNKLS